ncbi:uncharacterized protein LOC117134404 [Brassica rapa]|uniref:uncharacterized protein LOC111215940 n=1 Tax=Brassica napus TaxID=3708 RepID=UPI0004F1B6AD|nr:uncharacterized protein LOC111215940 [Brassica napus]XP_033148609.1 uncharacterized protein LOC117134404 [Brassica rapa]
MKIDVSEAFDSVQWPFLFASLEALGFHEKFVHWIRLCVSTTSFWVQMDIRGITTENQQAILANFPFAAGQLPISQEAAKDFHQVEVKIDVSTSFWHDHWCNLGRLLKLTGTGGHIDLGIPATATVAEAISTHRCRHHRTGLLNKLEDELDKLRLGNHQGYDISLWRSRVDKFKNSFSSKNTWLQIRDDFPLQSWSKVVWFKYATPKQSFHVWTAI